MKRQLLALLMMISAPTLLAEITPRPAGFTLASSSLSGYSVVPGARIAWHEQGRELMRDSRLADSELQSLIEATLRIQLDQLGLRFEQSPTQADLLLAYTAATERSLSDQELLRRFGLVPGYSAPEKRAASYERGSLVLYLVDPSNGRVVWRCAAQTLIDFDAQPETRRRRIEAGIASMFETLPVAGR